jgi:hypothetical protein
MGGKGLQSSVIDKTSTVELYYEIKRKEKRKKIKNKK